MNQLLTQEQPRTHRPVSEIAGSLRDLLRDYGDVAYVVGVKQARTVKNWAEERSIPADPLMRTRLEVAEVLAATVHDAARPWVSAAWLISCNPRLEESSTAELIQSLAGRPEDMEAIEEMSYAAQQFAATAN